MRTPQQALDHAVTRLNTGYNGYCLAHVQDSYGALAVDPSAITAWRLSPTKHTGVPTVPGLPIYFSGGSTPYGHIALWAGPDTMYTTDSGVGHPHYDSISKWIKQYGYTYLGYTLDIERQTIPGIVDLGDTIMAISDADARKIAEAVWQYAWKPGPPDGGNMYNELGNLAKRVREMPDSVWNFNQNGVKVRDRLNGIDLLVQDLSKTVGAKVWGYFWKDSKGEGMPDGGNMYNLLGNVSARVKQLVDRLVK